MKIGKKGLDLIKSFEGCVLTAYKVPGANEKYYTIGYGHYGADVSRGLTITQERAEELLKKDLEKFEKKVEKYTSVYKWNQNQFDAMVSFAYNVGSIDQLTAKGTRSIAEISAKITAYNKAGGKVMNGLVRRRKAEKELFDTPVTAVKSETKKETSVPKKTESIPKKTESDSEKFNSRYRNGKRYTVNTTSGLNLRKGYGKDNARIGLLANGTKVIWYGYYKKIDGVTWRKVSVLDGKYKGKVGYVSGQYLK